MTRSLLVFSVLLLSASSAFAQALAKPLSPPDVLSKAKTIRVTATYFSEGKAYATSMAILGLPNKAYVVDTSIKTQKDISAYTSDGTTATTYRFSHGRYGKFTYPAAIHRHILPLRMGPLSVLDDFIDPAAFAEFKHTASDADGTYHILLRAEQTKEETGVLHDDTVTGTLAVDPVSGLPKSLTVKHVPSRHPGVPEAQIIFTHWKLDVPVNDSSFVYIPPANAKLDGTPESPSTPAADEATAHDFTVLDKNDRAINLSDYRGKTVVVEFWTAGSLSQRSLAQTDTLAKKYAGKNVAFLAVNIWNTPQEFRSWLSQNPQYKTMDFATDPISDQNQQVVDILDGISSVPTQVVISTDGKYMTVINGYTPGDTQLEDALKKATFSQPALSGKP